MNKIMIEDLKRLLEIAPDDKIDGRDYYLFERERIESIIRALEK